MNKTQLFFCDIFEIVFLHLQKIYLICRRAKVARVIGLLALHTSELGENVPVSEVTFLFWGGGLLMLLLFMSETFTVFFFEPCFIFSHV